MSQPTFLQMVQFLVERQDYTVQIRDGKIWVHRLCFHCVNDDCTKGVWYYPAGHHSDSEEGDMDELALADTRKFIQDRVRELLQRDVLQRLVDTEMEKIANASQ